MIKKFSLIALCAVLFTQCMESSEKIKAFDVADMDKTANKCEDFYQWSVGTWMKNNPVPPTESRWMSFGILGKENDAKLMVILNDIAKKDNYQKGSSEQLIGDLYKSVLNRDSNATANFEVLKPYIDKIDAVQSHDELFALMPSLMKIGIHGPMVYYVGADRKNSTQNIAGIYQSGLSLPNKDYYLENNEDFQKIRANFKKHVAKMYALVGFENGPEAADQIMAYETEIAKISWSKTELRNPRNTYNIKSIDSFDNDELSNIPLRMLLDGVGISGIETINVAQPSYIIALDSLLKATSIDDHKEYFKFGILNSFASKIGAETEKASFEFYGKDLSGKKEMKPKEERVLKMVNGMLSQPLGKLFVDKHFAPESKQYISEMIENLRAAYKESIENLTWMSDETKTKALEKLAAFTYKVGYPDEWKDYTKLDVNAENLVQNTINVRQYNRKFMLDKLHKPVDKKEWGMPPQMVNAYYNPSNNEIVFPAGILQPPFFHPSFDDAINYGAIGGVIGHEFTHGFDDQGSKFDGDGNMNDWWTEEDRAAFQKLTSKLAEQYNSYKVIDSMHVKGYMTLGENIADLGGVTLGFAALKKKVGDNPPAPIDGFTWEQRFFLGWTNVWKGNITDEELKNRLINDYHSPAKYRVIGPLSNSPDFHDAFGHDCESGQMIKKKEDQIKIW